MITNIAFTVPGEPQGKGRARIGKVKGRAMMFPNEKTVAYEGLISYAAQQAMRGAPLFLGPCALQVDAVCSIPKSFSKRDKLAALTGALRPAKKPDADNVLKAVCDGMNGVVWRDDVQAVDVRLLKRYGETPAVHVRVAALGDVL